MTDLTTFGRRLAAAGTPDERLTLDAQEDRRGETAVIDAIIDQLLVAGLAGLRVIELGARHDDETVTLPSLGDAALHVIAAHADVDAMEHRGAWALPERETVQAGTANYAWWARQEPRFVAHLADGDTRKVTLRGNAAATFAWAAVTPVFELLCIPHYLRGPKAGKVDLAGQNKEWARLDRMLDACDFDLADELAAFRPRKGWSQLSADARADARTRLIDGWARHATPQVAGRLRMWMLGALIDRFYAKAKTSAPTSRGTLTKAHWRPMVAFFGGDWLALLKYLGEEANPAEEITPSLPEPKIYAGSADRARQAAADGGVDPAEVERMLASFFGGHDATSPVDRRLAVLHRVWEALDELHAAHTPGRGSLYGVLDERDETHDTRFDDLYTKGLHNQMLPAALNAEITALWGTTVISRAPDRLVTRWLPHHGAWDAFGPALQFWHEAALTTFAHTEVEGYHSWGLTAMADRQRPQLDELKTMGCSVDRAFFAELAEAGRRLPKIEHDKEVSRHDVGHGLSIEISFTESAERMKRPGFEVLRDVVTRHRRAWAAQHLDAYLQTRWQKDLRAAAESFNRALVAKGKPPTLRQTISASSIVLDRWFGGDVGQLLAAIGQRGPATPPTYKRLLPADPYAFGAAVQERLGRVEVPEVKDSGDRRAVKAYQAAKQHNDMAYHAAFTAYEYVRAREALGRRPDLKEVRRGKQGAEFLQRADPQEGWRRLEEAILAALANPPVATAPHPVASPPPAPAPATSAPPPPAPLPPEPATPAPHPEPGRRRGLRRFFGG